MENTMKKLGIAFLAMALVWSCGKDDGPDPAANAAPVIADQAFNVSEDITPADAIGTVTATDADGDKLTFAIKANDGDLFAITSAGALTLAQGKSLDFAAKAQHTITVEASDGDKAATAKVTVTIVGPDENTAPKLRAGSAKLAKATYPVARNATVKVGVIADWRDADGGRLD